MSVLNYKGYEGSVDYEDGRLIIQIMNIGDSVTTECTDVAKVEMCFAELVDDYIETCLAVGKEPAKPKEIALSDTRS
jgi:predicted HicB family RNase H-like nuclease